MDLFQVALAPRMDLMWLFRASLGKMIIVTRYIESGREKATVSLVIIPSRHRPLLARRSRPASCGKRHFFEFSLCLSRACLGKWRSHFDSKVKERLRQKRGRFSLPHRRCPLRVATMNTWTALWRPSGRILPENPTRFLNFSLCLSRARLGKMMRF